VPNITRAQVKEIQQQTSAYLHLLLSFSCTLAVIVSAVGAVVLRLLPNLLPDEVEDGGESLQVARDQAHPLVGAGIEVIGLGHLDPCPDTLLDFCNRFTTLADYSSCPRMRM
jgi:hypothetical protein